MSRSNTGRWMNPDDFKEKYGYDYTDDPEFDSRSDAGGGMPKMGPSLMMGPSLITMRRQASNAETKPASKAGALRRVIKPVRKF